MRRFLLLGVTAALVGTTASIARADPTPEQLKASYEETVRQLQQSQDRKNQLANENEQLKARVAELEGKLNAIDAAAKQAEFLRSQSIAWASFLERYPLLLKRFQSLARTGNESSPTPRAPEPFFDPEWPFSGVSRVEEEVVPATTMPTSAPTTTVSALVQMFHGGPNHWCAVCAAAAERKAQAGRASGESAIVPTDGDLMQDLPPR